MKAKVHFKTSISKAGDIIEVLAFQNDLDYIYAICKSSNGELEITTLNDMYLNNGNLNVQLLGRGFSWLDTGTMDSLIEAAQFVQMIEQRQSITISAPEEIGYINKWVSKEELMESAKKYGKSPYGKHLMAVAEGRVKY